MKRSIYFKVLKLSVISLSLVFLISVAYEFDLDSISTLKLDLPTLILSIVCSLVFRYYIAFIWFLNLSSRIKETKPSFSKLCRIFSISWIARYIPGGIFSHVSRIALVKEQNIDFTISIRASMIETTLQIISLSIILLVLLFASPPQTYLQELALLGATIILITFALLNVKPIKLKLNKLSLKLTKNLYPIMDQDKNELLFGLSKYITAMLIANLAFVLFSLSALDVQFSIIDLIIANTATSILSILIFFVPAGIGIKEASLTTLLAPILGADNALMLAVMARAWTIATDILFYILCHIKVFWSKLSKSTV